MTEASSQAKKILGMIDEHCLPSPSLHPFPRTILSWYLSPRLSRDLMLRQGHHIIIRFNCFLVFFQSSSLTEHAFTLVLCCAQSCHFLHSSGTNAEKDGSSGKRRTRLFSSRNSLPIDLFSLFSFLCLETPFSSRVGLLLRGVQGGGFCPWANPAAAVHGDTTSRKMMF